MMHTENNPTDESVKTGLQIASSPLAPSEVPTATADHSIDADDLIHEAPDGLSSEAEELDEVDADELVHANATIGVESADAMDEERDIDDVIHKAVDTEDQ